MRGGGYLLAHLQQLAIGCLHARRALSPIELGLQRQRHIRRQRRRARRIERATRHLPQHHPLKLAELCHRRALGHVPRPVRVPPLRALDDATERRGFYQVGHLARGDEANLGFVDERLDEIELLAGVRLPAVRLCEGRRHGGAQFRR